MKPKKKVMLIDDEKELCFVLKMNLEKTGNYEVSTECDSLKAVERIREVKPDIIFIDIIMPNKGGYAILSSIEEDEELKKIPLIILTATISKAEESFCGGLLTEYPILAKPVTILELINTIERATNK